MNMHERNLSMRNMETQRGFVLIIALIVLAAMALAAVSLVRTVDTSTLLSRNISFKRDAVNRNDVGMETAVALFREGGAFYKGANTGFTKTDKNYSAVMLDTDRDGIPLALKAANFSTTWTAGAPDLKGANLRLDTQYLIERMCLREGTVASPAPVSSRNCLRAAREEAGGSARRTGLNVPVPPQYRVTTKVNGMGFESYAQAIIAPATERPN
jgi:type IV pilus assembly protein PilX